MQNVLFSIFLILLTRLVVALLSERPLWQYDFQVGRVAPLIWAMVVWCRRRKTIFLILAAPWWHIDNICLWPIGHYCCIFSGLYVWPSLVYGWSHKEEITWYRWWDICVWIFNIINLSSCLHNRLRWMRYDFLCPFIMFAEDGWSFYLWQYNWYLVLLLTVISGANIQNLAIILTKDSRIIGRFIILWNMPVTLNSLKQYPAEVIAKKLSPSPVNARRCLHSSVIA